MSVVAPLQLALTQDDTWYTAEDWRSARQKQELRIGFPHPTSIPLLAPMMQSWMQGRWVAYAFDDAIEIVGLFSTPEFVAVVLAAGAVALVVESIAVLQYTMYSDITLLMSVMVPLQLTLAQDDAWYNAEDWRSAWQKQELRIGFPHPTSIPLMAPMMQPWTQGRCVAYAFDDVIETVGLFSVPEFVAIVLAAGPVTLVVESVAVLQHALDDAIEIVGLFSASELAAAALVVESVAVLQ
jgi:hypothetical protein